MVNDKRSLKRLRKRLQTKFGVDGANRFGFTEDISDTGIFIKSAIVMRPQSLLRIDLTTPDGKLVRLTGQVMWARKVPPNMLRRLKGGMGVRIEKIEEGAEAYRTLCAELAGRLG